MTGHVMNSDRYIIVAKSTGQKSLGVPYYYFGLKEHWLFIFESLEFKGALVNFMDS